MVASFVTSWRSRDRSSVVSRHITSRPSGPSSLLSGRTRSRTLATEVSRSISAEPRPARLAATGRSTGARSFNNERVTATKSSPYRSLVRPSLR